MHVIAYTSLSKIPEKNLPEELKNIEQVAQLKNAENGITGVLFFLNGRFLQIIEGKQADLNQLMGTLHEDPRNESISVLKDAKTEERSLTGWHMQVLNLDTNKKQSIGNLRLIADAFQEHIFRQEHDSGNTAMLIDFYKSILK